MTLKRLATGIFLALLLLVASDRSAVAAEPTPEQIVSIAYGSKGPETLQASMVMTLIDSGGKSAERGLEIRREGDDAQIVWFTTPANMRGTGFLRVVEEGTEKMWLYLPAFQKLERIGSTDQKRSFLGSDFTFADMAPHDLSKYDARLIGKEMVGDLAVHKLEFTLKSLDHDVLYSKIHAYVRTSDNRVVQEDLYDKAGDLIKQKKHTTIEQIGNYSVPTAIEMKDVLRNHITRLTMSNVVVDDKIANRVFSTKYLQKAK